MKYYVTYIDFNSNKIEHYNIFDHAIVAEDVADLCQLWRGNGITKPELIDRLTHLFRYCFWSKCEWEMIVSDLFDSMKPTKIDVYEQLKPNIPIIADMLISEWDKLGISWE